MGARLCCQVVLSQLPEPYMTNYCEVTEKNDIMTTQIGWWHHKNVHSPKPFTSDYNEQWALQKELDIGYVSDII